MRAKHRVPARQALLSPRGSPGDEKVQTLSHQNSAGHTSHYPKVPLPFCARVCIYNNSWVILVLVGLQPGPSLQTCLSLNGVTIK